MRIHIHIHTCIHSYIHTYIYTYIYIYIHRFWSTANHVIQQASIHTYTHTHIHTYIYTYRCTWHYSARLKHQSHIHTHIYTYIYRCWSTANHVIQQASSTTLATWCRMISLWARYVYIHTFMNTYMHIGGHIAHICAKLFFFFSLAL
jgi:hypothetical protein